MAKGGCNCLWVRLTGTHPFKRCAYCEKNVQECFGIQFFVIATGIISLLVVMFTIRDLPILAVEITLIIAFLIALLTLIANKETNEIIIGNALLRGLNEELEKRVEERTRELQLLNVELQKALRVKSDFLTNISHELRTPLTAVMGYCDIFMEKKIGEMNEQQLKFMTAIQKNSKNLLSQINNLLDLAKLEAGKLSMNEKDFDLPKLVSEATVSVEPMASKKNISITTDLDPCAQTVFGDPDRLEQILINLLDNAIKFTDYGGKIKIISRDLGQEVLISVEDSGIGISLEDQNTIFEKFKQIENSLSRRYPGSGIGLAIVKSLVEAHGGNIKVESTPGKGSVFSVSLPKRS